VNELSSPNTRNEMRRRAFFDGVPHVTETDGAYFVVCPKCQRTDTAEGGGRSNLASRHRRLPDPGDNGVLDPRELVKAMTVARAQKADELHRNFLRSRGVTPVATLRWPARDDESPVRSPSPARDATPGAATPQPKPSAPFEVGLGIHVNRLRGSHEAEPRGPLPKTPLEVREDRWSRVAALPVIGSPPTTASGGGVRQPNATRGATPQPARVSRRRTQ